MTVAVNIHNLESTEEVEKLITYAVKNCKGFRGAAYKDEFGLDCPLGVQFFFDTEEDAIIFNLKDI
jgi:hypothetical protein